MKKLSLLSLALLASLAAAGCSPKASSNSSPVKGSSNSQPTSETSSSVKESSSEKDSSTAPVEVKVPSGDAAAAIATPGTFYYQKDESAVVDGVVENDVTYVTISGMTTSKSVVFYYEAPNIVTGNRYQLSFVINSKAVMQKVTINGTVYELVKGDNTIDFRFTETDDPTLTILMGDESDDYVNAENEISLSKPTITDVQYAALTPVVDGNLDEWKDTKNEENSIAVIGSDSYAGKGVTFYASLQSDGLYIAADAYHSVYIADGTKAWWECSNLEFFLGDGNVQGWVSANPNDSKKIATESSWTISGDETTGYHSIVEGFIPTANLPENSVVAGEIRVGFAWKTIGDKCNNGEANGGAEDEYWVPKGTWPNNADKGYVTKDGIFRSSQVAFEISDFTTVALDGDLADWEGINGVTLTGTGDYSYKNVTWYARLTNEGMFVAAKAHHDVYINNDPTWHCNTNLEFWVSGDNQKYISANGNCAGGVYGTHKTTELEGDGANYETVFEAVIPNVYLEGYLKEGIVTIGFAFKTNGDVMTGGGANNGGEDAWWILPTHDRINEQFTVTENGLVDPKA